MMMMMMMKMMMMMMEILVVLFSRPLLWLLLIVVGVVATAIFAFCDCYVHDSQSCLLLLPSLARSQPWHLVPFWDLW